VLPWSGSLRRVVRFLPTLHASRAATLSTLDLTALKLVHGKKRPHSSLDGSDNIDKENSGKKVLNS
jgi:hypothetical protein